MVKYICTGWKLHAHRYTSEVAALSGWSMAALQPLSVLVAYSVYCPMMQSNAELGSEGEF